MYVVIRMFNTCRCFSTPPKRLLPIRHGQATNAIPVMLIPHPLIRSFSLVHDSTVFRTCFVTGLGGPLLFRGGIEACPSPENLLEASRPEGASTLTHP